MQKNRKRIFTWILLFTVSIQVFWWDGISVSAEPAAIEAPSAVLLESSTGKVIFEQNARERRSPASITKIMTLLLTFEALDQGKIKLEDPVTVSAYASSMGGSQVFLAENEVQTLETMIKCIAVASGNDASVAVAEYIAGSEEAFVDQMNQKAAELGMVDTHFEDCCGLTDSDGHYTTAMDVAIMSRELTVKYPQVFEYTGIWMEDITHETRQGSSTFTLNSTNKLLKQYQWATGLKTGSTSKAKFCLSATATKDGIDLIAVVMGAPDYKARFKDAQTLLSYGFNVSDLYLDENTDALEDLRIEGGVKDTVPVRYQSEFRYLDTEGNSLDGVKKTIELPEKAQAPVAKGAEAGRAAGSEEAFVDQMNQKAAELGMVDTHFEDCCGLTDSDGHYTTAMDVAIMSRELTVKYPQVFEYTGIWMEDITHETRQGSSTFTLNSTNKLLKQYQWATGLKTGSTSKAKFCLSATATKDGIDLIAVVMGAPDYKARFKDAQTLLSYGFNVSDLYLDENTDALEDLRIEGGVKDTVPVRYQSEFRYLDTEGNSLDGVKKTIELPEKAQAPVAKGAEAGRAVYLLNGVEIGSVPILYENDVAKAVYKDYLFKIMEFYLL